MAATTIFISHVTEEREVAWLLKELIEDKFLGRVEVFVSSHEESINLGDRWLDAIATSVNNCGLMVVICSPLSVSRPWINFEAGAGWLRNIPVVPMCHSGLTPGQLPVPLNTFQGGLVGKQEDVQRIFKKIAEVAGDMRAPVADDASFFCGVKKFETNTYENILLKDSTFIFNILMPHVHLLGLCIYASTMDYEALAKVDPEAYDLRKHTFTFNDVHRLFNNFTLLAPSMQKVYQVIQVAVNRIDDNIRFILSNSRLKIAPELDEVLAHFLYVQPLSQFWSAKISVIDQQPGNTNKIREMAVKIIQEEPLPPTHKPSNLINVFIDYHNDLVIYRDWIIQYKELMARLTRGGLAPS